MHFIAERKMELASRVSINTAPKNIHISQVSEALGALYPIDSSWEISVQWNTSSKASRKGSVISSTVTCLWSSSLREVTPFPSSPQGTMWSNHVRSVQQFSARPWEVICLPQWTPEKQSIHVTSFSATAICHAPPLQRILNITFQSQKGACVLPRRLTVYMVVLSHPQS